MEYLLYLGLILLFTKLFGLISKKMGLPQVVGAIIAGIFLGPSILNIVKLSPHPLDPNNLLQDPIKLISEIGVILILFTAGLSTNLKEMKKTGASSFFATIMGFGISQGCGMLLAFLYFNKWKFDANLFAVDQKRLLSTVFIGATLTATSVGIVIEALNELGLLKGKVGSSIMAAAILDDIIGIILLTLIIGVAKNQNAVLVNGTASVDIGNIFLKVLYFFLSSFVLGIVIHYIFKFVGKKYDHKRRLPVITLSICFLFSYLAVKFEMSDITGAYVAGVFIANLSGSRYVEKRIDTSSYLIFSPVFFATIGLSANLRSINSSILIFTVLFVSVGLFTKFFGCSIASRIAGYTPLESKAFGVGMMVRGEVALIIALKGNELGYINSDLLPSIILLTIVSSIISPIILKFMGNKLTKGKVFEKTVSIDEDLNAYIISTKVDEYKTTTIKRGHIDQSKEYTDNMEPRDNYKIIELS